MTFSTQLSVHFRHTAISVAQMHRFIRDTCTDICCTCGVFRLHGLSLKDQTRFWCLRLVTNVNIVFIEVMVLFVKAVKDRNARKSSEQNLYVSMYIWFYIHVYTYIIYMCIYIYIYICSSLSVLWPLTTFCLAPSWCLLTVHKRSWLEGQGMSKQLELVWPWGFGRKWNWRISFTIILRGVSHKMSITGNVSLP